MSRTIARHAGKAAQVNELLQTHHDYGLFHGSALVAEQGEVICKKGLGLANIEWGLPIEPDTRFRIGSITKQFTATLILQLAADGLIQLEGKLSDYLPDYRKDTGERVSIHHLLTHTSGIPSYTTPSFFADVSRDPYEVDAFLKQHCSEDLEFQPGDRFNYSNSGYFLLGAIIATTLNQSYDAVLTDRILTPLGMTGTGYDFHATIIEKRATGYTKTLDGYTNAAYLDISLPYAAGAMYSTVEDLYLWDQALYTSRSARHCFTMDRSKISDPGLSAERATLDRSRQTAA